MYYSKLIYTDMCHLFWFRTMNIFNLQGLVKYQIIYIYIYVGLYMTVIYRKYKLLKLNIYCLMPIYINMIKIYIFLSFNIWVAVPKFVFVSYPKH